MNELLSPVKRLVEWLRRHLRFRRGADLSLVDVGFSLTVANGLVPLQNTKRKGEREINGGRGEKDTKWRESIS